MTRAAVSALAALAALAALVALCASAASAVKLTVYKDNNCTGDFSYVSADSGACSSFTNFAAIVECDGSAAESSWTADFFNSSGCTVGPVAASASGAGPACVSIDGAVHFSVDCSVVTSAALTADVCVGFCGSVSSSCYTGTSTVVLEGNKEVLLSEVNVGDRVLSVDDQGEPFFDKVFRVTTWDEAARAVVVRISTADGHSMELTPGHYVHLDSLDADNMTLARDVAVGRAVFVVSADGRVSTSEVVKVERVLAEGLFNVHTLSGRLVVDGIVGSHFTVASSWKKKSLAPYWYFVADLFGHMTGSTVDAKPKRTN